MNKQKLYNNIIDNAQNQNRFKGEQYYECHHIIPRCLGGKDTKDNLVLLTAREHFIAHYLLCKIYPSNIKLLTAFLKMKRQNNLQQRYFNSRLYESARLKYSKYRSSQNKKYWKNVSVEQLQQRIQTRRQTIQQRNKKYQKQITEANRQKSTKYWNDLTNKQKEEISQLRRERMLHFWQNMSTEERIRRGQKVSQTKRNKTR